MLGSDGGTSSTRGLEKVNPLTRQYILTSPLIRSGRGSNFLFMFRPIRSILTSIGHRSGLSLLIRGCQGSDLPIATKLIIPTFSSGSEQELQALGIPSRSSGSRTCTIFVRRSSLLLTVSAGFMTRVRFSYAEIVLQPRCLPPFHFSSDLTSFVSFSVQRLGKRLLTSRCLATRSRLTRFFLSYAELFLLQQESEVRAAQAFQGLTRSDR